MCVAIAKQPIHSQRSKRFASTNTEYSTGFSSFDRARIGASAKKLGEGGGGRRRKLIDSFLLLLPPRLIFWARETHHKSMAASDIL